jgi:hypothetical protein
MKMAGKLQDGILIPLLMTKTRIAAKIVLTLDHSGFMMTG